MAIVPTALNGRYPEWTLGTLPGSDGDGTPHTADLLATQSYARVRRDMRALGLGDLVPSTGYSCYRTRADQQHMRDIGLTTVPVGKSIHGEAKAVDFQGMTGARLAWLRANGRRYGWYQPAWAVNGIPSTGQKPEPWHWEYDAQLDTAPAPVRPDLPDVEDEPVPEPTPQDLGVTMPLLVRSNQDSTVYLVTETNVKTLTTTAQYTPFTACGVKMTPLDNGDIGNMRAVLDAIRLENVNQVAAASAAAVKAAVGSPAAIDVQQLATLTAQALAPLLGVLPDSDVERIAEATADQFSTRLAQ